jgi:hypothetical protein
MPRVQTRRTENGTAYVVKGRELHNGDELLLRLRGNGGWEAITIAGLPGMLRARVRAADGKELVTSLPIEEIELRWP